MDQFWLGVLTGYLSSICGFAFYYWASNPKRKNMKKAYNKYYGVQ